MCRKVAAYVECGILYPVVDCAVIQCTIMEKVLKDLTLWYIRQKFDQLEGPVKKVFRQWGGLLRLK
jgi:hypothetical protein